MALVVERIPTLRDNYTYLVSCRDTREAVVIDAPEVEPVLARIEATGVRVVRILSTHHHPDHAAANPALADRLGVAVVGFVGDAARLPGFTSGVSDGDEVEVGMHRLRVLHVPGHTTGHVAYFGSEPAMVFCGDTLFGAGCGRLFEGTPEQMYRSLVERLAALPEETLVYCGHEYTEANLRFAAAALPGDPEVAARAERVRAIRARASPDWHAAIPEEMTIPSTIGEERRTNPFLRARDAAGFARLRTWKDGFR